MTPDSNMFVGVILQASLVAVGLLIAIFGIVLPSIKTILEYRISSYTRLLEESGKIFDDLKEKSPKDFNYTKITNKIAELDEYKNPLPFPKNFVYITILLYGSCTLMSTYWYFNSIVPNYQSGYLELIGVLFGIATFVFVYIAYKTLNTIFKMIDSISEETRINLNLLKSLNNHKSIESEVPTREK
jgi:hypothetical protein